MLNVIHLTGHETSVHNLLSATQRLSNFGTISQESYESSFMNIQILSKGSEQGVTARQL